MSVRRADDLWPSRRVSRCMYHKIQRSRAILFLCSFCAGRVSIIYRSFPQKKCNNDTMCCRFSCYTSIRHSQRQMRRHKEHLYVAWFKMPQSHMIVRWKKSKKGAKKKRGTITAWTFLAIDRPRERKIKQRDKQQQPTTTNKERLERKTSKQESPTKVGEPQPQPTKNIPHDDHAAAITSSSRRRSKATTTTTAFSVVLEVFFFSPFPRRSPPPLDGNPAFGCVGCGGGFGVALWRPPRANR